jgi:hypothetical protein
MAARGVDRMIRGAVTKRGGEAQAPRPAPLSDEEERRRRLQPIWDRHYQPVPEEEDQGWADEATIMRRRGAWTSI